MSAKIIEVVKPHQAGSQPASSNQKIHQLHPPKVNIEPW